MKYLKPVAVAALLIAGSVVLAQQPAPPQPVVQAAPPVEYTLKLTAQEVDMLGKALGSLPFNDVAPFIQKLRQQIVDQQQPPKSVEKKK